jgi:hypothetical protein
MLALPPGREANSDVSAPLYTRHRPRLQGKDCSYNPFAFPPLHMAGIAPAILLHSRHPWRSDVQVPRSTGCARAAIHGGQMQEIERRRKPKPRTSCRHREDPHPPRAQRRNRHCRAFTTVSGAAPGQLVRLKHHRRKYQQRLRHRRRARVAAVPSLETV